MVTLEELSALDLLIWKRTGVEAASAAVCNQSTISRRLARVTSAFGLRLRRSRGEWEVRGPALLLSMERELHQLCRLLGRDRLRLEISPLVAPLLVGPVPAGWMLGRLDQVGMVRPLQLLRERIIDAWLIDNTIDLPPEDDPEIARFDLFRYPLWLAADARHPLAGCRDLAIADVSRFPVPHMPQELFPTLGLLFDGLGLCGPSLTSHRYDPADWEGRTADGATLMYATPFNLESHRSLHRLDTAPLLINGVALVCRRDVLEQGPILALRDELERRLLELRPRLPGLEPIG